MDPQNIPDLVIRSRRVVAPSAPGGFGPAAIEIRGSTIRGIYPFDEIPGDCPVHEAGDSVVMPGVVDTHVHFNEPGRTEWEGFTSGTRSAAAGGVTTVIEMPLNSIPATTTAAAFRAKLAASEGKLWADTGFWGGVVPGNVSEIRALWEAGIFGFKSFLVPSGVAEFAHVSESDLRGAIPELVALGAPLLVHAELPAPIEAVAPAAAKLDVTRYATWLFARPRASENEAIELLLRLSREFRARVHIVHLSSSEAHAILRRARAERVAVSVETCPHYLSFAAEEIPDRATEFKCAPPIRERENRELLWAALGEGLIDFIASDHSPCPAEMKSLEEGSFLKAWGGIASLELTLPAVWTEAHARGFSPVDISRWMCEAPARLAGLEIRKGKIAVGYDADIVIWNPESKFRVESARLHHRHKITPYAGRELAGVIVATFLRGRRVYERGEFVSGPLGAVLLRGQS
ncbi:MAG: allantoinase AllB [Candidatus Acidiferrales bacterium]